MVFTKKDILKISNEAYSDFSKKHKINCEIKLINSTEFWKIAKRSELVKNNLKKGIPVSVGALVSHKGKTDVVYVSDEVINTITDDPKFVKAIFIHEFYHIYLKSLVKNGSLKEASLSEKRTKSEMKEEFPDLAKLLR